MGAPSQMGRRGKRRKFAGPQARRISAGADSLRPEDFKIKGLPWGLPHGKRHDRCVCIGEIQGAVPARQLDGEVEAGVFLSGRPDEGIGPYMMR